MDSVTVLIAPLKMAPLKRAHSVFVKAHELHPLRGSLPVNKLGRVQEVKGESAWPQFLFNRERSQVPPFLKGAIQECLHNLYKSEIRDLKKRATTCKSFIARLLFIFQGQKEGVPPPLPDEKTSKQIVQDKFQEIQDSLKKMAQFQQHVGIHSEEESYTAKLPLAVAKILLLPDGTLNLGLIKDVQEFFFTGFTTRPDGTHEPIDWQARTKETLQAFLTSYEFVAILESITAPKDIHNSSQELIRATLALSPEEPINDYHARLVALATLLSAVRQGHVGNCFAISNVIWFLTALIGRVLADFRDLLQNGCLHRIENGQNRRFPFLLRINDPSLDKSFTLTSRGMVAKMAAIWQVPGFLAAAKTLGAERSEERIKQVVSLYNSGYIFETTPREFIENLASLYPSNDKHLACLAFSAETIPLLYHAYASALCSIDQAGKDRYLHQKITSAEKRVFKPLWKELKQQLSTAEVKRIKLVFEEVLSRRLLIQYDETIKCAEKASDGKSQRGAFVYLEVNDENDPTQACHIQTPIELGQFFLHSLDYSLDLMEKLDSEKITAATAKKVKSVAQRFMKNRLFLANFFNSYDPAIPIFSSLDEQFRKFSQFGQIGGDSAYVFLHGANITLPTPEEASGQAEDRLCFIIKLLRKLETQWRFLENTVMGEKILMESHTHSFSLDLENNYVRPWITSPDSVESLIQQKIYVPTLAILKKEVTAKMRIHMASIAKEMVVIEFHPLLEKVLMTLSDKKELQPYAETVFKIIIKLNPHWNLDEKSKTQADFTNAILNKEAQLLTEEEFNILESTTLPIPDTNWKSSVEGTMLSVYIGFGMSPVTGKIEIFEINENQTGLLNLSQRSWDQNPWRIYALNLSQEAKKISFEKMLAPST